MSVKVIAIAEGYYSSAIIKPGSSFTIAQAEDFSSVWMRPATKEDEKKVEGVLAAKASRRSLLVDAIQKDMDKKNTSEIAKAKKILSQEAAKQVDSAKKGSKGQADDLV